MIRTDGNVIHADFGMPAQPDLPLFTVSCNMLYLDDHVALARLTYRIDGQEFIQHVVRGDGIDA